MPATNPSADFVTLWKRVGPILARIRRDELRRFDWDKDWPIVDALMDLAVDRPSEPSTTSGLVELQRLMRRAFG